MDSDIRILFVGTIQEDALRLKSSLALLEMKTSLRQATSLPEARSMLGLEDFNLILLDLTLPGSDNVKHLADMAPHLPLVVLADPAFQDEMTLQAIESGAQECLAKDQLSPTTLARVSRCAMVRKHAEIQLQTSEEKYRLLLEEAIEGIVQLDARGHILSANQSFVKMLGYASFEDLSNTVSNATTLVHLGPEDFQKIDAILVRDGKMNGFELQLTRKDGQNIWVSTNFKALRSETGKVLRVDARVLEITNRKEAEALLEQKTSEMDQFFNVTPDLLCVIEKDGRFSRLNRAWTLTLGYPMEELQGKSYLDFVHPEDIESTRNAISNLAARRKHIFLINRYLSKDGSYRWVEWHAASANDRIYVAARDISRRKQAEDELYDSRQRLQLILDTIPQRIFWKDLNLNYLGCNRSFAMDAGLPDPARIIGKDDSMFTWKDFAEAYLEDDREVMRTNTPKLFYEEQQMRSYGLRWVRTSLVPLHDREDKVIGVLGSYEDITDRKQAEEQVSITNAKLTQLVSELEKRNNEATLLRKMGDLLQICNEPGEAYQTVEQFCPQLFPDTAGALYIVKPQFNVVEEVSVWGDTLSSEKVFPISECWSLRRGQLHKWDRQKRGFRCRHVDAAFDGNYLDVPLVAMGELIGMLYIETPESEWKNTNIEELASSIAEHIALSLSSLRLREKLKSQSIRDPLTGLFNRRYMQESLEKEMHKANRKRKSLGIIMLDIDHFKAFNEKFGHDGGDVVLSEMGSLLQAQIRAEDIACRYGGEEFLLIMPEVSQEIIYQRAEQIRVAVKTQNLESHGQKIGAITISVGVALYPDHEATQDGLIKKADEALYAAKRNGRDRVEVATP